MVQRPVMVLIRSVVILAVTLSAAFATVVPPAIPMVFVEGAPYTVGSTIVSFAPNSSSSLTILYILRCSCFRELHSRPKLILTALRNDTFYNTIMLPYYRTPKGAALYENMFAAANHSFSQYVDELQGMADAIGVTLEEVSSKMGLNVPF